jgi:hypothetical protein
MQRKSTKNTRGPNAYEKAFQGWLKMQPCAWCGNEGPGIVDHCRGATFKHNKTLIGHWFCIPQCVVCDEQKTVHGKRLGNESEAFSACLNKYTFETGNTCPDDVYDSIVDWGR